MAGRFGFVLECWCLSASLLCACLPAQATLGEDVSTVQADNTQLKAKLQVRQATNYSVHEMQSPGGSTVREYVSPMGKVFAVTWQGPVRPDLEQLLGSYYQQVVKAVEEEKANHPGRHPISIQQPGLVVQFGGHQRALVGRVYLPELLPPAVQAEEIR